MLAVTVGRLNTLQPLVALARDGTTYTGAVSVPPRRYAGPRQGGGGRNVAA